MDKILCVLAGYDADTEQKLCELQNRLYEKGYVGTHTKDVIQHITIGTFSTEEEKELIAKIKQTACEQQSFSVQFNHIGVFGGSKVLFVAPDINESLLNLAGAFKNTTGWTPHTTMLIDEPKTIYEALPVVADNFKAFTGNIVSLNLYEFWPTRLIYSAELVKA